MLECENHVVVGRSEETHTLCDDECPGACAAGGCINSGIKKRPVAPRGAESPLGEQQLKPSAKKLQMNVRTSVGDNKSLPRTDYSRRQCK